MTTPICPGCKNELLDPDVCYCGSSKSDHSGYDNHPFVPIGCDCLRDRQPKEPPGV